MTEAVSAHPDARAPSDKTGPPARHSSTVRTRGQRRLRASFAALLLTLIALDVVFRSGAFVQYEVALIIVYAIAALGQDLLMGRAGQISLGTAAFMAIGAFITAGLDPTSWAPFPIPAILSALGGVVVGLLVIAAVADRLLAMNFGKALGEGTPEEVLRRADVLEAYVGLEAGEPTPH